MTTSVTPPVTTLPIGIHPALPMLDFAHRLGVHNLHRIEEARAAYDMGCRAFTLMNNVTGAREIKNKGDTAVIYRRFVDHGVVPDPVGFAQGIGLQADDRLIVMGLNEADNISTSEIERRYDWDSKFATEAHRLYPNCFIVIGSFSMGTPAIETADVATRWRATYAPFLNANYSWCGLNYHSYHRRHAATVPPFNHEIQLGVYWPGRWSTWGYDPTLGGLNPNVVLVGDESGVDIGGIGGYPACGYTDNYFYEWWKLRKAEHAHLPQVYVQNLFQYSNNETGWAGYDIRCVLGMCQQIWKGQVQ